VSTDTSIKLLVAVSPALVALAIFLFPFLSFFLSFFFFFAKCQAGLNEELDNFLIMTLG
jgi:hypothetical protein